MTAKAIDADVIRNKLDAVATSIAALESAGEVDAARLRDDPLIAAAVERLLGRLVDLAVDVNAHISAVVLRRSPGDYRESFDLAAEAGALSAELASELKPSVGLRNTIVHEYVRIDYDIVASSIPEASRAYAEYQRQIAEFVVAQTL